MLHHQSQAIVQSAKRSGVFPPESAWLPFLAKRGRGGRLHDIDGNAFDDFWLSGGRLPFGHAPSFAGSSEKNCISTGYLDGYLNCHHLRLLARLAALFPGYNPQFAEPEAILEECAVSGWSVSDEREESFCLDAASPGHARGADVILIDGALFLPCVLAKNGLAIKSRVRLPATTATVRAENMLRKLTGNEAPYAAIERLISCFDKIVPRSDKTRGFPTIELTDGQRLSLLEKGFLIGPDNRIRFCSAHDPRTVRRLAQEISRIVTGSR